MKAIQWMVVSAALAIGMAAPTSAATTDPEVIIYRFPGVRDNGGGTNTGVATVFHCTNFSGVSETIRFVVRDFDTTILANAPLTIGHLSTITVSTKLVGLYFGELSLNTSVVTQGTAAIAATSTSIICTAMTIDAAPTSPVGIALRGIRFNPVPGSQE